MKKAIPLLLLGFGVALAVIIGQRMSTDAMAVVIGVAVGVAASVPTSLLLVALLRRASARRPAARRAAARAAYPPASTAQPDRARPGAVARPAQPAAAPAAAAVELRKTPVCAACVSSAMRMSGREHGGKREHGRFGARLLEKHR